MEAQQQSLELLHFLRGILYTQPTRTVGMDALCQIYPPILSCRLSSTSLPTETAAAEKCESATKPLKGTATPCVPSEKPLGLFEQLSKTEMETEYFGAQVWSRPPMTMAVCFPLFSRIVLRAPPPTIGESSSSSHPSHRFTWRTLMGLSRQELDGLLRCCPPAETTTHDDNDDTTASHHGLLQGRRRRGAYVPVLPAQRMALLTYFEEAHKSKLPSLRSEDEDEEDEEGVLGQGEELWIDHSSSYVSDEVAMLESENDCRSRMDAQHEDNGLMNVLASSSLDSTPREMPWSRREDQPSRRREHPVDRSMMISNGGRALDSQLEPIVAIHSSRKNVEGLKRRKEHGGGTGSTVQVICRDCNPIRFRHYCASTSVCPPHPPPPQQAAHNDTPNLDSRLGQKRDMPQDHQQQHHRKLTIQQQLHSALAKSIPSVDPFSCVSVSQFTLDSPLVRRTLRRAFFPERVQQRSQTPMKRRRGTATPTALEQSRRKGGPPEDNTPPEEDEISVDEGSTIDVVPDAESSLDTELIPLPNFIEGLNRLSSPNPVGLVQPSPASTKRSSTTVNEPTTTPPPSSLPMFYRNRAIETYKHYFRVPKSKKKRGDPNAPEPKKEDAPTTDRKPQKKNIGQQQEGAALPAPAIPKPPLPPTRPKLTPSSSEPAAKKGHAGKGKRKTKKKPLPPLPTIESLLHLADEHRCTFLLGMFKLFRKSSPWYWVAEDFKETVLNNEVTHRVKHHEQCSESSKEKSEGGQETVTDGAEPVGWTNNGRMLQRAGYELIHRVAKLSVMSFEEMVSAFVSHGIQETRTASSAQHNIHHQRHHSAGSGLLHKPNLKARIIPSHLTTSPNMNHDEGPIEHVEKEEAGTQRRRPRKKDSLSSTPAPSPPTAHRSVRTVLMALAFLRPHKRPESVDERRDMSPVSSSLILPFLPYAWSFCPLPEHESRTVVALQKLL